MKPTVISIVIAVFLIGGAFIYSAQLATSGDGLSSGRMDNVTILEGRQIIEIDAKGGYSPRTTTAQAGMPTVLKVKTSGTFDCSSALAIPSLAYRVSLPASGEVLIEVPPQEAGFTLRGICAMGMYDFEVNFI